MIVIKRRLIFWLIKAYIKRWGRAILVAFLLGLVIFFLVRPLLFIAISKITTDTKETIGVVGSYTLDSLPPDIFHLVSRGLTKVGDDGAVKPDLASSWNIKDGGKTYIITLQHGLYFSDGTSVIAKHISLAFSDVTEEKPDDYHIIFHLKQPYAPFLVTLSRPVFASGFVGIGNYKIGHIIFNGSFIQSLTLIPSSNGPTRIYQFYPTQDALKIAFALGEISTAQDLTDISFQYASFANFPNVSVDKHISYNQLVTLFYNTQDSNLSDKKLRDALSYAIPNTFSQGERAYGPFSPLSWAYQVTNQHNFDATHAKLLLDASYGDGSKLPTLTISTLSRYQAIARIMQSSWQALGIQTKIDVVEGVPQNFQVYLGDFTLPKDPDQYTLWHSYQTNNISNFNKNPRIDKLLEDGRKTNDKSERQKIYADFQKYLADEEPATFLYFPYLYTISRK